METRTKRRAVEEAEFGPAKKKAVDSAKKVLAFMNETVGPEHSRHTLKVVRELERARPSSVDIERLKDSLEEAGVADIMSIHESAVTAAGRASDIRLSFVLATGFRPKLKDAYATYLESGLPSGKVFGLEGTLYPISLVSALEAETDFIEERSRMFLSTSGLDCPDCKSRIFFTTCEKCKVHICRRCGCYRCED